MTFNEYWNNIKNTEILPSEAIVFLPASLSDRTKRQLMEYPPMETAKLLSQCITKVNQGSVESIESLLNRTMTYRLNPNLSKISSPIVLLIDKEKLEFPNGKAVAAAVFTHKYNVTDIKAKGNKIEITLIEQEVPKMNWSGEEPLSFF